MSQRVAKWDNVKFILICFVVLGHVIDRFGSSGGFIGAVGFFLFTSFICLLLSLLAVFFF